MSINTLALFLLPLDPSALLENTWSLKPKTMHTVLVQSRSLNLPNDIQLTHYQTTNFTLFQTERVCRRQFQI